MKSIDLTGQRFGKLIAVEGHSEQCGNKKRIVWKCICDCGNISYVVADCLKRGDSRSCGCSKKEFFAESKKRTNAYEINKDITTLYTRKGSKFFIDTEDLEKVLKICWVERGNGYLCGKNMETGKVVLLHRYLLDLGKNDKRMVDHVNRNPKDNRKSNLRICTCAQNSMNKGTTKSSKTGVNGVSYIKERRKWLSRIMKNGVLYELGAFADIKDAIKARKEAEIKLYGEFAPKEYNSEVM